MSLVALDLPVDHPAFAGHFPGHPLAPGVLLLQLAQRAIEAELAITLRGLAAVKFVSPALPGQPLDVQFSAGSAGVRFEIRSDARLVATGTFVRAQSD